MTSTSARKGFSLAVAALALGISAPAFAGTCTMAGTNPLAGAPTDPKDVTDTVIGSVDLGKEVQFAGHDLRMRRLVVQPGGIVPLHSHTDRPALIYTLSGTITEYRSSCSVPIVHTAGDIAREADGISHYWINHGTAPVVLLSSDVHHGK